jgi:hypothetical protein
MSAKRIFYSLILLNGLFVVSIFVNALLLEPEIKKLILEAENFAENHHLNSADFLGINDNDQMALISVEKMQLLAEYTDLLMRIVDLRSEQRKYLMWGQLGLLGFPIFGFILITLTQRERDNLSVSESRLSDVHDMAFTTPRTKTESTKRIMISAQDKTVYFEGFTLLKGFVISPKESAFEVPFVNIIDCFIQPLKGRKSFLILLTTKGKVSIPDTNVTRLRRRSMTMQVNSVDVGWVGPARRAGRMLRCDNVLAARPAVGPYPPRSAPVGSSSMRKPPYPSAIHS